MAIMRDTSALSLPHNSPSCGAVTPPWAEEDAAPIELHVSAEKAGRIHTGMVDGERCLLIPLEEGESARINGRDAQL